MHKEVKLLLLGIGHIAAYFLIAWVFMPRIADNVEQVVGPPFKFASCSSRSCEHGIKINNIHLACEVSAIGISYGCANFYKPNSIAHAKYFSMPTIFSLIGLSNPSLVLIEMRQDGQTIYEKSQDQLRMNYFFQPSFVSIVIFIIAFLASKKHRYFN